MSEEVNLQMIGVSSRGRTRGLLGCNVIGGEANTVFWDGGGMKNVNS